MNSNIQVELFLKSANYNSTLKTVPHYTIAFVATMHAMLLVVQCDLNRGHVCYRTISMTTTKSKQH